MIKGALNIFIKHTAVITRMIKEIGRVVSLMIAAVVVLSDLDLEELGNHWLLMIVKMSSEPKGLLELKLCSCYCLTSKWSNIVGAHTSSLIFSYMKAASLSGHSTSSLIFCKLPDSW